MPSGAETHVPEEVMSIANESVGDNEKNKVNIFAAGEVLKSLSTKSPKELGEMPKDFIEAISTIAALHKEATPFTVDRGPENPPDSHKTPAFLEINIDEEKRQKDVDELKNTELFKKLQESKGK